MCLSHVPSAQHAARVDETVQATVHQTASRTHTESRQAPADFLSVVRALTGERRLELLAARLEQVLQHQAVVARTSGALVDQKVGRPSHVFRLGIVKKSNRKGRCSQSECAYEGIYTYRFQVQAFVEEILHQRRVGLVIFTEPAAIGDTKIILTI